MIIIHSMSSDFTYNSTILSLLFLFNSHVIFFRVNNFSLIHFPWVLVVLFTGCYPIKYRTITGYIIGSCISNFINLGLLNNIFQNNSWSKNIHRLQIKSTYFEPEVSMSSPKTDKQLWYNSPIPRPCLALSISCPVVLAVTLIWQYLTKHDQLKAKKRSKIRLLFTIDF